MASACESLFDDGAIGPKDEHGCVLPVGHDDPHEFADPEGKQWLWETDWECDCTHCMQCDGDYCLIYWAKPNS